MHKRLHDTQFKKRAPHALKHIREFAEKTMGTKDVRIEPEVNKACWARGIKGVPLRLRVKLARKHAEDENAKV